MSEQPPRPDPLGVNPDAVPEVLTEREQWVCWQYSFDTGRYLTVTEPSPCTGWREAARRMGVTPGRQRCDTSASSSTRGHRVRVLDGSGRLAHEVAR